MCAFFWWERMDSRPWHLALRAAYGFFLRREASHFARRNRKNQRCSCLPPLSMKQKRRPEGRLFCLVGEDGFGPSKLKSNRFTVCPLCPLGNSPVSTTHIIPQKRALVKPVFCKNQKFLRLFSKPPAITAATPGKVGKQRISYANILCKPLPFWRKSVIICMLCIYMKG